MRNFSVFCVAFLIAFCALMLSHQADSDRFGATIAPITSSEAEEIVGGWLPGCVADGKCFDQMFNPCAGQAGCAGQMCNPMTFKCSVSGAMTVVEQGALGWTTVYCSLGAGKCGAGVTANTIFCEENWTCKDDCIPVMGVDKCVKKAKVSSVAGTDHTDEVASGVDCTLGRPECVSGIFDNADPKYAIAIVNGSAFRVFGK